MSAQCCYKTNNLPIFFNSNENLVNPPPKDHLQLVLIESGCTSIQINRCRCFIQSGALIFRCADTQAHVFYNKKLKAKSIAFKPEIFELQKHNFLADKRKAHFFQELPLYLFFEVNPAYVGVLPIDNISSPKVYALFSSAIYELENKPDNNWQSRVLVNLIELLLLSDDEYKRFTNKENLTTSIAHLTLEYIRAHYDKDISISLLCRTFHTNHTTLLRGFRELTGTTVGQYLIDYRLKLVCEALIYTSLTLGEIALKFGFKRASYMSRVFRNRIGVTPGQYRQNRACLSCNRAKD
mgnify:CR=1 FL=1